MSSELELTYLNIFSMAVTTISAINVELLKMNRSRHIT